MSAVVNSKGVYCPRAGCKSLVIRSKDAELVQRQPRVPLPAPGNNIETAESLVPDELREVAKDQPDNEWFWRLQDMMKFENVGFSHEKDGVKFLSCADCDYAPIGFHDKQSAVTEYLVAVNCVSYRD
ncbi:hypothetical protein EV183_002004 [Coemansia sp. RSA 2336]|nr:hypothetical protein EV183_002004 [Coemansia sp. RSA 2336]